MLPARMTKTLPADHKVVLQTPGGGGMGDPFKRKPEAVLQDVVEEFISAERARTVSGVEINVENMTVDTEKTAVLRRLHK